MDGTHTAIEGAAALNDNTVTDDSAARLLQSQRAIHEERQSNSRGRGTNCRTSRSTPIHRAYVTRFMYWCDNVDRCNHAVDERKMLDFIQWLSLQPNQHAGTRRTGANQTIMASTLKTAAVDVKKFWTQQQFSTELVRGADPWTSSLSTLLQNKRIAQENLRIASCADPTHGTMFAAGRTPLDIGDISSCLLKDNSALADRTRADITICSQTAGRGNESRNMNLSRCIYVEQPHLGPSKGAAMALILRERKGQHNVSFMSLLRHKFLSQCGVNAFGVWIWRRFEHRKEEFPDFSERALWYNIKLFTVITGKTDRTTAMSYTAEADQIAAVLKRHGINANMCTHIFRHDSSEKYEMNSDGHCSVDSWTQHGGWNYNVFARTYAGVAISAV